MRNVDDELSRRITGDRERERALDAALELANVERPIVVNHRDHRRKREQSAGMTEARRERVAQAEHVFFALAKRGQANGVLVQAREKIAAEFFGLHGAA